MGKGKGKKGKRGGKPGRGAAGAKRPEVAAGQPPAVSASSPDRLPTATGPQPELASATSTPDPGTCERAGRACRVGAATESDRNESGHLRPLHSGAYCILAGLFSPWGFNIWDNSGRSAWGVFWLALGGGLLYAGWYLSAPDAPPDGQSKNTAQRPRR